MSDQKLGLLVACWGTAVLTAGAVLLGVGATTAGIACAMPGTVWLAGALLLIRAEGKITE